METIFGNFPFLNHTFWMRSAEVVIVLLFCKKKLKRKRANWLLSIHTTYSENPFPLCLCPFGSRKQTKQTKQTNLAGQWSFLLTQMFPVWNLCLLLMRSSPVWNLYAVASGMETPSKVTQVVEPKTNSSLNQLILGSNAQVEVVILGGQVSTMESIASPEKNTSTTALCWGKTMANMPPHILLEKKSTPIQKDYCAFHNNPVWSPKRGTFSFG